MRQSAELKCSEMWSETAAHNHLHKWGLQGFGFSSHLPGILHFLCADQMTDNAFDIWTPFSWVHCIRLFFNNFCALFFIRYVSFPYKNVHNGSFRILLKLKVSWLMKDLLLTNKSNVLECQVYSCLQQTKFHSPHFLNAPWPVPNENIRLSRFYCILHLARLALLNCQWTEQSVLCRNRHLGPLGSPKRQQIRDIMSSGCFPCRTRISYIDDTETLLPFKLYTKIYKLLNRTILCSWNMWNSKKEKAN